MMIDDRLHTAAERLLSQVDAQVPPDLPEPPRRGVAVASASVLLMAAAVVGLVVIATHDPSDRAATAPTSETSVPAAPGTTAPAVTTTPGVAIPGSTIPGSTVPGTPNGSVPAGSVKVYNASTTNGVAGQLTVWLQAHSYSTGEAENAPVPVPYDVTVLYYVDGYVDQAQALAAELGVDTVESIDHLPPGTEPAEPGTTVLVFLGMDIAPMVAVGYEAPGPPDT